jgi:hypothetical protein
MNNWKVHMALNVNLKLTRLDKVNLTLKKHIFINLSQFKIDQFL